MDRTEEVIRRGLRAKQLLDDEVFKETIEELLHEQWQAFLATDPLDKDAREKIHSYADAIGGIVKKLETNKANGAFEQSTLGRENHDGRTREFD